MSLFKLINVFFQAASLANIEWTAARPGALKDIDVCASHSPTSLERGLHGGRSLLSARQSQLLTRCRRDKLHNKPQRLRIDAFVDREIEIEHDY